MGQNSGKDFVENSHLNEIQLRGGGLHGQDDLLQLKRGNGLKEI